MFRSTTRARTVMWSLLCCCALLLIGGVTCSPAAMMKESTSVSHMRMADLETSETGYAYDDERPGERGTYVGYANRGIGAYYEAPKTLRRYVVDYGNGAGEPLHSGTEVIASLSNLRNSPLPPGYVVPLLPPRHVNPLPAPIAPYYHASQTQPLTPQRRSHEDLQNDRDYEESKDYRDSAEKSDESTEEEHGEDFNAREHSTRGENDDEGYQSRHTFDNGEREKHGKDRHEGHYSKEGGTQKSGSESGGNYNDYDEVDEANDGEGHEQKSYHDKGEKTTGYHNVYRKDEYKKDTDFYDQEHKGGHYDKHSSSNEHHSSAEGKYKKGEKHDAAHENREKGKNGHYDKGHENSLRKGFKSKEGDDSHYQKHSDYAATEGTEGNKKYSHVKAR